MRQAWRECSSAARARSVHRQQGGRKGSVKPMGARGLGRAFERDGYMPVHAARMFGDRTSYALDVCLIYQFCDSDDTGAIQTSSWMTSLTSVTKLCSCTRRTSTVFFIANAGEYDR